MRNTLNKFFILSPETKEEENDMMLMMKGRNNDYALYHRFFNKKYRYFSKILDCFLFLFFILKNAGNSNVVILGAPCLRNRLVSVFLNKKYIMYLRCLHSSGEKLTYLSDKIDYFFKKFGINNRLTNPYVADAHLVTSYQTKNFLDFRNAGKNIFDIGAIWLKDKKLRKSAERKIYFISQAFAEHDLAEAQIEQIAFVNNLNMFLKGKNLELIIKKHPRDYHAYENYTLFDGNADDFINQLSETDIVISFFSTLGFEISLLNGNVKFISLPSLREIYNPLYIKNNVFFYEDFGMDFSFLFDNKKTYNVFSDLVNVDVHKII